MLILPLYINENISKTELCKSVKFSLSTSHTGYHKEVFLFQRGGTIMP